jgi:hypothetical protein
LVIFSETCVLNAQERKPVEPPQEDRQVLRALLDEMRQLRLALQRANAVNHRLQITVERLRLQQVRVDSIALSLENVRSRMSDLKTARPQMEEQMKYAEEAMARATEQTRREEIEHPKARTLLPNPQNEVCDTNTGQPSHSFLEKSSSIWIRHIPSRMHSVVIYETHRARRFCGGVVGTGGMVIVCRQALTNSLIKPRPSFFTPAVKVYISNMKYSFDGQYLSYMVYIFSERRPDD